MGTAIGEFAKHRFIYKTICHMIFIDICILVSVRVYKEVLSESARKGINICELAQHGFIYKTIHDTSSTAQGSGGSFKNRKPIGEIGCCESRMAERIR